MSVHRPSSSIGPRSEGTSALIILYLIARPWACRAARSGAPKMTLSFRENAPSPTIRVAKMTVDG